MATVSFLGLGILLVIVFIWLPVGGRAAAAEANTPWRETTEQKGEQEGGSLRPQGHGIWPAGNEDGKVELEWEWCHCRVLLWSMTVSLCYACVRHPYVLGRRRKVSLCCACMCCPYVLWRRRQASLLRLLHCPYVLWRRKVNKKRLWIPTGDVPFFRRLLYYSWVSALI